jgi:soluble lytic murein transglycosylase
VLAPYLEYWRLKLRLDDMPNDEVRGFLERQAGTYLADRLRADWLKQLGKRADWQSFDRELSPLVQDDLEIRCYAWLSRLARGDDSAHDAARAIWLEPRELPEGCFVLANKMTEGASAWTIRRRVAAVRSPAEWRARLPTCPPAKHTKLLNRAPLRREAPPTR